MNLGQPPLLDNPSFQVQLVPGFNLNFSQGKGHGSNFEAAIEICEG